MLGPADYGGPIRGFADCGCGKPGSVAITSGPNFVPTINPCAAATGEILPGNTAVTDAEYQCSIGVSEQASIDEARRLIHVQGLQPYRVFLVWQQRTRQRTWELVHRCELMPVRVLAMNALELSSSEWGEDDVGGVSLDWVSPNQVDEDVLRGYLNGEDWAAKSDEREFFYEIQLHKRCALNPLDPRIRRFIQAGEPHLNGQKYQFEIVLAEQKVSRSRGEVDQTIGTEFEDTTPLPFNRPVLVT